jgi:serine protease Do
VTGVALKWRSVVLKAIFILGLLVHITASANLVDLIARAKPAVVIVGTLSPTDSPRFNLRATGFVVGDGNTVVTNAHVLPELPNSTAVVRQLVVQVLQPGGLEARAASIVRVDKGRDLAILKMEGPPVQALRLGKADYAPEGTEVAFIGFPIGGALGYSPVVHRGIVSSVTAIAPVMPTAQQLNSQSIYRLRGGNYDIYQLDATAYPGNSGGPLLSVDSGEVIGVINSVAVRSTKESALSQPSGITYAIPIRFVSELMAQP